MTLLLKRDEFHKTQTYVCLMTQTDVKIFENFKHFHKIAIFILDFIENKQKRK